ncbi:MAG: 16S rRNA (cytosine(967)-C(5))-methyltransferase RsmB [Methylophilaceae bacterium]|nr:16S rRNA (cytosine(967)-C(5))-methyltransferase RsmB [Methylophilaceae bacterium]
MYISQQIAAMAVADVLAGRNLTLALPDALNVFPKATPQQKGGGADLSYGTLRFFGEVNAYLTQLLEKPLSNTDINALLLVAIYQLLHDQAEDFTVVNQAVKAASYAKPRWAKSLVNGVLRNFLRQKASLAVKQSSNEVAVYAYQQWWINKLKQQYPNDWQAILQVGNTHPPMTLRVNAKQSSKESYAKLLARHDISLTRLSGTAVMLTKPMAVEQVPGFSEGVVSVQDYGAQLAASLLDVKSGMRVLDACSAPGGKTGHLLETAQLHLTALDNDAGRLERVASNLTRLQMQADLQLGDAASWQSEQAFDRILADVPCTASGIVRRHVDIKWLRRESDIVSFTQQQAVILANLWHLLAKGGKLLYATCSVFAEENQQQIDRFLQLNSDARQLPIVLTDDRIENIHMQNGQLLPTNGHDGFFYALLQKV